MKIVSSGKVLNSSEFYKKKKSRKRVRLILLLVVFLSVVFSFAYFSRQEQFLITEVMMLEKNIIDKKEIIQVAQSSLTGNYLWIIPRASVFIYPRLTIERSLLEQFPRLESIDLDLNEAQQLLITVQERAPFALYCVSTINFGSVSECYFLDKDGFIFASAPSFSSPVYFVFATGKPIKNPIGKRFATVEEFKALLDFTEALAILSIVPLALELADAEYSLVLPNSAQIMWRRDSDFALIYSNLEAFLSDDAIRSQSNFLERILYIDLRTENKIRWKFKK